MTITLQAVNELIHSLESAGELSIKERKYLELAKEFKQLAAENVGLKAGIGEAYDEMEQLDDGYFSTDADGEPMDTLITLVDAQAAIQRLAIDIETPATDRIVAEAEARGVEKFAAEQRGVAERLQKRNVAVAERSISFCLDSAEEAEVFAQQLREGADK